MKNKILNMALAAAITPLLCCCTSNFEEYNTNPYEPHSLNPPMLFATMITTGINVQHSTRRNPGIRFLSIRLLRNSIPTTLNWKRQPAEKVTIGQWRNCFA